MDTKPTTPKKYTNQEIAELLTDCVLVKDKYWHLIPSGALIRYYRNDTDPELSFKRGGYIMGIYPQQDGTINFSIKGMKGSNAYNINTKSVSRIYKRIDPKAIIEVMMIRDSMAEIRERLTKLETRQ